MGKVNMIIATLVLTACGTDEISSQPNEVDQKRELEPCPDSPNCVSSLSKSERHGIDSFQLFKSSEQSLEVLKKVIQLFENATIVKETDAYLKAEFKTSVFKFIDDVEFLVSDDQVHVRSASRTGYYDFGKNRKRVEMIRQKYKEATSGSL